MDLSRMSIRARVVHIIVEKNRRRLEKQRDRYGLWLWQLHRENRRKDQKTMRTIERLRKGGASMTSHRSIADQLNMVGSRNHVGGLWTHQTVRSLLLRMLSGESML
jgi:hypothetical protein